AAADAADAAAAGDNAAADAVCSVAERMDTAVADGDAAAAVELFRRPLRDGPQIAAAALGRAELDALVRACCADAEALGLRVLLPLVDRWLAVHAARARVRRARDVAVGAAAPMAVNV